MTDRALGKPEVNNELVTLPRNDSKQSVKFEIKNHAKSNNLHKEHNKNILTNSIVPTHQPRTIPKNESKNSLKSAFQKDSQNLTQLLTKNDLKPALKSDLSSALRSQAVNLTGTLPKCYEKNVLQYDNKTMPKVGSKSTLKSDSKNDLHSLSGTLTRSDAAKNASKNDVNALHKDEVTSKAAAENTPLTKKRLESMSDEEIIQENLKEILDKKSREERKANGRLVAVIIAFLVIFLAIYHAWIRKAGALAGVLVPALIMLSYGGWVVILAKRDKQKKALFEKHLEEVTQRNKAELAEKAKLKKKSSEATLHYEHEKSPNGADDAAPSTSKSHRQRQRHFLNVEDDARPRRPSIREKLFRQRPPQPRPSTYLMPFATTAAAPSQIVVEEPRRKRLQRMDALIVPQPLVRMGSAP